MKKGLLQFIFDSHFQFYGLYLLNNPYIMCIRGLHIQNNWLLKVKKIDPKLRFYQVAEQSVSIVSVQDRGDIASPSIFTLPRTEIQAGDWRVCNHLAIHGEYRQHWMSIVMTGCIIDQRVTSNESRQHQQAWLPMGTPVTPPIYRCLGGPQQNSMAKCKQIET